MWSHTQRAKLRPAKPKKRKALGSRRLPPISQAQSRLINPPSIDVGYREDTSPVTRNLTNASKRWMFYSVLAYVVGILVYTYDLYYPNGL